MQLTNFVFFFFALYSFLNMRLSGGRLLAVIGLVQACTALSGAGRAQGIIQLRLRGGGILQLAGDEDTAPNTGWVTERDPAKRKQLFNSVTRVNHKEEFQKRRAQGMPKKSRGPIWREVRDFACGAVVSVSTLPTSSLLVVNSPPRYTMKVMDT